MLAKRLLANAPRRFEEMPGAADVAEYWRRFRALAIDPCGLPWEEVTIRFAAWQPEVAACVVGTKSAVHLRRNIEVVSRGPLPEELSRRIRDAFTARGAGWKGLI